MCLARMPSFYFVFIVQRKYDLWPSFLQAMVKEVVIDKFPHSSNVCVLGWFFFLGDFDFGLFVGLDCCCCCCLVVFCCFVVDFVLSITGYRVDRSDSFL